VTEKITVHAISRLYPGLYLFLNGLLYFGLAMLFFTEPLAWFGRLQVNLVDMAGYTELKTMYVGVMVALGAFFMVAALIESWRPPGVVLAVFSFAGLATVRGWGIYVEQVYNELIYQLLLVEIADLLAGLLALYCLELIRRKKKNPYF
jgi:hypothetical protein